MSVTAAQVKALFPEVTLADGVVESWLAVATLHHNVDAWGTRSDWGLQVLTAHYCLAHQARVAGRTGPSGPVSSRAVGPVSTSFAVAQLGAEDAELSSTRAGQLYLRSRKGVFADRRV